MRDIHKANRPGLNVKQWVLTSILALCIASPCCAHQKWLWPNRYFVEKAPVWLSFDVTWSDVAFAAEKGVGDQPLSIVGPIGRRESPARIFIGKTKSTAETELTKEGTYRFEAVDPLKYWTRVERNGDEQWLDKAKDEVRNEKVTRADLYWAKAVAYVTVGKESELQPPDKTDPLDIVMLTHPNQLRVDSPIKLRVLSYGKPLPRAEIKMFSPDSTGHEPGKIINTDDQSMGETRIEKPGQYLFTCEVERKVANDPKADIHSFHFYLAAIIR
jgi:uncharacterized GH25 family protein